MLTFLARRIVFALVTTVIISVLSFIIIQLPPGDYVSTYISEMTASGGVVTQEQAIQLRANYGLDQPFYVQYFKWISQVAQGNLGMSLEWRRPVGEVIGERLLLTIIVSVASILLTWVIALPVGIYSAVKQYSIGDYVATFVGFVGLAVPSFLLALVIMYFAFALFNMSVGGLFSPQYVSAPWSWRRVLDLSWHLPLPAFILALGSSAQLIRIMRANLLDELRKPYLTTALAKGMAPWRAILKYPVRVALNPFISTIGYILPFVVSGSVVISLVLGLPTVGPVLYRSLLSQDMFLAGTIVLFLGVLTVLGTLLSDILLIWIDPRIRTGSER